MIDFLVGLARTSAYPADLMPPGDEFTPFPTNVVKKMLSRMARPMPGYGPHQVGAGFVNEELAKEYLLKFSFADAADMLLTHKISPDQAGWPNHDAPFISEELLTWVIKYQESYSYRNYRAL